MTEGKNDRVVRLLLLCRVMSVVAIFASVLQGSFFVLDGSSSLFHIVAVGLAAGNILVAIVFLVRAGNRQFWRVLVLYVAQVAFFFTRLIGVEVSHASRILEVAVVLIHLSIILSILLSYLRLRVSWAIAVSVLIAVALFAAEASFDRKPKPSYAHPPGPKWSGNLEGHPVLGMAYKPNSILKTFYPDNPRGYFKAQDLQVLKYWLRIAPGSDASLVFPNDGADFVRVTIARSGSVNPFDVQLNLPHYGCKANTSYVVRFRARSDQPRSAFAGFSQSHDPWKNLGFYRKIELTGQWQTFTYRLTASDSDRNARIHFDLGGSDRATEFSFVELLNPNGETIEPNYGQKFAVSYRFNSNGCRGPDYAIPRPPDTERILMLGDSNTLGVGVYEEDTYASRLQNLLNQGAKADGSKRTYEVINCGVRGYTAGKDRLFYEITGRNYEPGLVLFVATPEEDAFEMKVVLAPQPLFYAWAKVSGNRKKTLPLVDYSNDVRQILELGEEVRQEGRRLAVVIFRTDCDSKGSTDSDRAWNDLTKSITDGLRGSNIPILDLGEAMRAGHTANDLMVHPKIDPHPNEIAHAIAAKETFNFIRKEKLLP